MFGGLHASETFHADAKRCGNHSTGPMSAANQALSFIVFKRDIAAFNREFPQLTLIADEPHTHLRYVVSGGVNFRQLLPDVFWIGNRSCRARLFAPLAPLLALQHTLVLEKELRGWPISTLRPARLAKPGYSRGTCWTVIRRKS